MLKANCVTKMISPDSLDNDTLQVTNILEGEDTKVWTPDMMQASRSHDIVTISLRKQNYIAEALAHYNVKEIDINEDYEVEVPQTST